MTQIPEFKTKKAKKEFVRALLKEIYAGRSPEFAQRFLKDLVAGHPSSLEKIGPGILEITVRPNIQGNLEMNITRVDGTKTDISWVKCISGKETPVRSNLLAAMRQAVSFQTWEAKLASDYIGKECPVCGLAMDDTAQVDHENHFSKIAETFLSAYSEPPTVFDDCPTTNAAKFRFEDSDFGEAWENYHKQHAILRMICLNCNQTREKYIPSKI